MQCDENRHTDIENFATLIHTKKRIHCEAIFTRLYGNYYPPYREFKLICIGKLARRTWVYFTQQYGKNRQRCQQNAFYYAVWQLLLYLYREFPSKIFSVQWKPVPISVFYYCQSWKNYVQVSSWVTLCLFVDKAMNYFYSSHLDSFR